MTDTLPPEYLDYTDTEVERPFDGQIVRETILHWCSVETFYYGDTGYITRVRKSPFGDIIGKDRIARSLKRALRVHARTVEEMRVHPEQFVCDRCTIGSHD